MLNCKEATRLLSGAQERELGVPARLALRLQSREVLKRYRRRIEQLAQGINAHQIEGLERHLVQRQRAQAFGQGGQRLADLRLPLAQGG